jgi:tetratricopeptide (TPR) repeat protein
LQQVNHPYYRNKGLRLQLLLDAVHEKSGQNDLQMSLHTVQIDMAHHNHTGDTELGNDDWETYLQLEPQLATLGSEKAMEFYTDFHCKRAVNLMDMFRYDEAGQVLIATGQKEEDFAKNTAAMFGSQPEDLPKERIGWVYSSLGQVCAFQGNRDRAEEMFRSALQCFDKKNDIEREWVYLGHLACDFPEDSQSLLNEVFEHLPQSTDPFEEPFILALKLKTVYVFGNAEQQKQWAENILTFIKNNEETLPFEHPWGLIYQITAMLFDKIGNTELTQFMFHQALWAFDNGEGVLKELGRYCQLRMKGKPLSEKIRFNYW